MVIIDEQDCTGCDLCILHCPFEALLPRAHTLPHRRKRDVIVLNERCVGCLSCIGSCPTYALKEMVVPPTSRNSPLMDVDLISPSTEAVSRWGRNDKHWA